MGCSSEKGMNPSNELQKIDPASAPLPYGLEEEIDLIEYLVAVFRNKYWILLFAFVCGGAGFGLAKILPHRYESSVQLALREPENPGGVAPDNRRAPEVLTLMEHGFVMNPVSENYRHIIMAQMRSRVFTNHFILTHDVLPRLFAQQWDERKQEWIDGYKPDLSEAYKIFNENIRSVVHNPENDLIRLYIYWRDARVAAEWANAYIKSFNDFMRDRAIQESRRKRDFLMQQLRKTSVVEVEKSIYRMIEAETAVEMLAQSRENFVLEVLDDAVPADYPYSPSKRRMAAFGFFAGFGLGLGTAIGSVLVRKIRYAMQAYRARTEELA